MTSRTPRASSWPPKHRRSSHAYDCRALVGRRNRSITAGGTEARARTLACRCAGSLEPVDRCADPEGVAERRPDSGHGIWSAGRRHTRRRQRGCDPTAIGRFRIRDRCRGLHPHERSRRGGRAAGPDCFTAC